MPKKEKPTGPKHQSAPDELEDIVRILRKDKKLKLIAQAVIKVVIVTGEKPMVVCKVESHLHRDMNGVHGYLLVGSANWDKYTGTGDKDKKREVKERLQIELFRELAWLSWDGEALRQDKPRSEHPAVVKKYGMDAPGVHGDPLIAVVRAEQLKLQIEEDEEPDDEEGVTNIDEGEIAAN